MRSVILTMFALAAAARADVTIVVDRNMGDAAAYLPDASPVKWHLAHTSWFFETFVLDAHVAGYRLFEPSFRVLFNSYYNGIGDKHPRHQPVGILAKIVDCRRSTGLPGA